MQTETVPLSGPSPGTTRTLTRHHWGKKGARPKVYLQAGLHADEMPGPLALYHLMALLDAAEAEGRITGHVVVVPLANPIGLSEWLLHKPMGRRDLEGAQNFNRVTPILPYWQATCWRASWARTGARTSGSSAKNLLRR